MSTIWTDEEPFMDRPDQEETIDASIIPQTPAERARIQREAQERAKRNAKQPRPTGVGAPPAPPKPFPEPEVQYDHDAINSEEEDDFSAVLSDANLRLQQGTLYQMVMNSNLFESMDVDPRAIKNVEREIKRFARERMEIMLGMRQERQEIVQHVQVASPFNSLEVKVLKDLASAASKGATSRPEAEEIAERIERKTSITPIAAPKPAPAPNSLKANPGMPAPKPLAQKPAAPVQRKPAPAPAPEPVDPNDMDAVMNGKMKKPLHEMTPAEIEAHNREAAQRQRPRAKNPSAAPIPTGDQLYMLHATKQAQMDPKAANAISTVMALMGKK
jgi:predicted transcriptional regulator